MERNIKTNQVSRGVEVDLSLEIGQQEPVYLDIRQVRALHRDLVTYLKTYRLDSDFEPLENDCGV